LLIKPRLFKDNRGHFFEKYKQSSFKSLGINEPIVQFNESRSTRGTLRGLHFQVNFPQAKLLRCLKGKVFDVAVDIRKDSSTYGRWVGEILSDENKHQLFIPAGFAHGYYVMSRTAEIAYKCSEVYHHEDELGLRWNDPDIAIEWPALNPILSNKDAILPFLADIIFNKDQSAA